MFLFNSLSCAVMKAQVNRLLQLLSGLPESSHQYAAIVHSQSHRSTDRNLKTLLFLPEFKNLSVAFMQMFLEF